MKKLISILIVAAVMCMMVLPVSASDCFVPSIGYKDHPELDGCPVIVAGEKLMELVGECLEIIPVSEVMQKAAEYRTEVEQQLAEIYQQIKDGSMKLPFEGENADKMVIRDLFDVRLICEETHADPDHVGELEKDDTFIELTFDLGIAGNTKVTVMTYHDGAWSKIRDVKNNGNGTITCQFDHFCPVAFCVEEGSDAVPPQTGDVNGMKLVMWSLILVASLTGIVTMLLPKHRQSRKHR